MVSIYKANRITKRETTRGRAKANRLGEWAPRPAGSPAADATGHRARGENIYNADQLDIGRMHKEDAQGLGLVGRYDAKRGELQLHQSNVVEQRGIHKFKGEILLPARH